MAIKDEVWKTKDGTYIEVKDMSESHVRNALRLIIRNRRKAIEANDQFINDLFEESFPKGCDRYGSLE